MSDILMEGHIKMESCLYAANEQPRHIMPDHLMFDILIEGHINNGALFTCIKSATITYVRLPDVRLFDGRA